MKRRKERQKELADCEEVEREMEEFQRMKQLVRDSSSEEIVEMAERHDKAAERHEQEAKRKRVRDVGLWAKARRGWRRKKVREVSRRGLRGVS